MSAPFTRRAMLLALGVDIPTEIVDDIVQASASIGASRLNITSLVMSTRRNQIEVTTSADPAPVFIQGIKRVAFAVTVMLNADGSIPVFMTPLEICEEFGGRRFEATLYLTEMSFDAPIEGLMCLHLVGEAFGPVRVTTLDVAPEPVAKEDAPLLRAMRENGRFETGNRHNLKEV